MEVFLSRKDSKGLFEKATESNLFLPLNICQSDFLFVDKMILPISFDISVGSTIH